jgi:hypothetical protein
VVTALPRTGMARADPGLSELVQPTKVRRDGNAREVYGIAPSLLHWRDKKQEGCCRVCKRPPHVRWLTLHHLVPESFFRNEGRRLRLIRNVAANLVPLCWPCHVDVERDHMARRMLRKMLSSDEVAFCVQVRGPGWFDRRYPASAVSPAPADDPPPRRRRRPLPWSRIHKKGCSPTYGCVYGCPCSGWPTG